MDCIHKNALLKVLNSDWRRAVECCLHGITAFFHSKVQTENHKKVERKPK